MSGNGKIIIRLWNRHRLKMAVMCSRRRVVVWHHMMELRMRNREERVTTSGCRSGEKQQMRHTVKKNGGWADHNISRSLVIPTMMVEETCDV
jgi:hypothetical protein